MARSKVTFVKKLKNNWKNIAGGVAGVVVMLLLLTLVQSDEFRVERSAQIKASPYVVSSWVNDMHRWNEWSPWAKLDPEAKTTYSGPRRGKNAALHWDGDGNVGAGTMTIVESQPGKLVKMRLDFERPFKGTDTAEFTFKAEHGATTMTWAMYGEKNFMAKLMGLFFNCERMMGRYFEEGLGNLKKKIEG